MKEVERDKGKPFWSQLRDTVLILGKSLTKELSVEMAIFLFFPPPLPFPHTAYIHPLLLKLWSVVSNGHHVLSDLLLNKECLPSSSGNQVSPCFQESILHVVEVFKT